MKTHSDKNDGSQNSSIPENVPSCINLNETDDISCIKDENCRKVCNNTAQNEMSSQIDHEKPIEVKNELTCNVAPSVIDQIFKSALEKSELKNVQEGQPLSCSQGAFTPVNSNTQDELIPTPSVQDIVERDIKSDTLIGDARTSDDTDNLLNINDKELLIDNPENVSNASDVKLKSNKIKIYVKRSYLAKFRETIGQSSSIGVSNDFDQKNKETESSLLKDIPQNASKCIKKEQGEVIGESDADDRHKLTSNKAECRESDRKIRDSHGRDRVKSHRRKDKNEMEKDDQNAEKKNDRESEQGKERERDRKKERDQRGTDDERKDKYKERKYREGERDRDNKEKHSERDRSRERRHRDREYYSDRDKRDEDRKRYRSRDDYRDYRDRHRDSSREDIRSRRSGDDRRRYYRRDSFPISQNESFRSNLVTLHNEEQEIVDPTYSFDQVQWSVDENGHYISHVYPHHVLENTQYLLHEESQCIHERGDNCETDNHPDSPVKKPRLEKSHSKNKSAGRDSPTSEHNSEHKIDSDNDDAKTDKNINERSKSSSKSDEEEAPSHAAPDVCLQLPPGVDSINLSSPVFSVVLDNEGKKRGYGFVRFTDEADQGRALNEMNNFSGIGGKAIRVSLAAPKRSVENFILFSIGTFCKCRCLKRDILWFLMLLNIKLNMVIAKKYLS